MYLTKNNFVNKSCKRSFTLIELLIAGMILAMIALAVFSTFVAGIKVYKKIEGYGIGQRDVLLSLEVLEKDLINTFGYSGINFMGDSKNISFAALIKPAGSEADNELSLGRVSYYFDPKTNFLIRREQSYSQALSKYDTEGLNSKKMVSAKDVSFSYYYFNPKTQKYGWDASCVAGSGIPRMVRIKVIIEDENKNIEFVRTVLIPVAAKPFS